MIYGENRNGQVKYKAIYGKETFFESFDLDETKKAIKNHDNFFKSKYTKKGRPRKRYGDLKSFWIVDNNGNLYYIY